MSSKIKQKLLKSLLSLTVVILLLLPSPLKVPLLDPATEHYFETAMTKAVIAYATCRAINASVSIVKESSLQLEPAGVGISLAVGQILGPVDDMIERLSNVLVMAITSLGVQKLAYEISITTIPYALAAILILLTAVLWFNQEKVKGIQSTMFRILALLVVVRLFLPVASMLNEVIYVNHFKERIAKADQELGMASEKFGALQEITLPEVSGVIGTFENSTRFVKERTNAMKQAILHTLNNMDNIVNTLLELTFLYVGLFVIQVLLIPLLSLWLLIKLINRVFDPKYAAL